MARHVALGDLAASVPRKAAAAVEGGEGPMDALVDNVLASGLTLQDARDRVVQEFERRYVRAALERHGGNVTRAADASGVGRRYFQMLKAKL